MVAQSNQIGALKVEVYVAAFSIGEPGENNVKIPVRDRGKQGGSVDDNLITFPVREIRHLVAHLIWFFFSSCPVGINDPFIGAKVEKRG